MIHLSRSTAVFAVCLLLSIAVVYRFFPAENKSIFAQRYGSCTPPDGTKHTNVRRAGTKYKTIVKDMHYPLVSCGFSTLAPLAKMRYTGNTKTNVKENFLGQNLTVLPAPSEREPLAQPDTLHFSRKLYRHAKGPIPEGAGCDQREQTGGVLFPQQKQHYGLPFLPLRGTIVESNIVSMGSWGTE